MRNNNCRLLELWLFLSLAPMLTSQFDRYLYDIALTKTSKPSCSERRWYQEKTPVCRRLVGRSLSHINTDLVPENACLSSLEDILKKDNTARDFYKTFEALLTRYDCSQPYSIKFNCKDCQEVYKVWVCSLHLDYFLGKEIVKPCRSVCHAVEQKCPFFLPLDKSPAHYAGEPSFLCIDPFIEETEEQRRNSSYAEDCCYEACQEEPEKLCLRGSCSSSDLQRNKEKAEPLTVPVLSSSSAGAPANNLFLQLTVLTNYLFYFKLSVT